jgi:hypothetical protein
LGEPITLKLLPLEKAFPKVGRGFLGPSHLVVVDFGLPWESQNFLVPAIRLLLTSSEKGPYLVSPNGSWDGGQEGHFLLQNCNFIAKLLILVGFVAIKGQGHNQKIPSVIVISVLLQRAIAKLQ